MTVGQPFVRVASFSGLPHRSGGMGAYSLSSSYRSAKPTC